MDIHDEALRRQSMLSTADLRFADFLVKSVCEDEDRSVYDETGMGAFTCIYLGV